MVRLPLGLPGTGACRQIIDEPAKAVALSFVFHEVSDMVTDPILSGDGRITFPRQIQGCLTYIQDDALCVDENRPHGDRIQQLVLGSYQVTRHVTRSQTEQLRSGCARACSSPWSKGGVPSPMKQEE